MQHPHPSYMVAPLGRDDLGPGDGYTELAAQPLAVESRGIMRGEPRTQCEMQQAVRTPLGWQLACNR